MAKVEIGEIRKRLCCMSPEYIPTNSGFPSRVKVANKFNKNLMF